MAEGTDRDFEWTDGRVAGVLGGGAWVLYAATSARHLLGGDAGEFATIAGTGGYAHPPGYPLYSMYLAVVGALPLDSAAHAAAVGTSVLGAAAVALLYLAVRAWGSDRFGALFAAVLFGTAPQIWWLHTVPEAFALNHLVVAGVLYAAAPGAELRGRGRMLALGASAAVAVAHHHMAILMLPVGLAGVVRACREAEGHPAAELGLGAATSLSGLATYAYLPWVTASVPEAFHWAEADGWASLVRIFFRRAYGTFELSSGGVRVGPVDQLGTLAVEVGADLAWAPLALVLAGGAVFALGVGEPETGADRRECWAVLAAWILSGPAFVALIGRGVEGSDYLHLRKFHAQFELICCLLAGVGATWLHHHVRRRWVPVAIVASIGIAGVASALPFLQSHTGATIEQYVDDTLASVPEEAILVGNSDHRYFGMAYAQRVEDRRGDVVYVDSQLLTYPWYRRRIERRVGVSVRVREGEAQLGQLIADLQAQGRSVFVTHVFDESFRDYWTAVPVGTAYRLHPPEADIPTPAAVYRRNRNLLDTFAIEPRPDVPETSWNHLVLTHYGLVWRDVASALAEAGHPRRARRARDVVSLLAPWMASES